jgi:TRAP transporter TAXI family solute receptor
MRLLQSADMLPALQRDYGDLYFRLEIPQSAYPGLRASLAVVGVANVLVVNRSMPDDLAYDVTRLLFEKQRELEAIHPEARNLSLKTAVAGSPAPFHPGAVRFYRERGAL